MRAPTTLLILSLAALAQQPGRQPAAPGRQGITRFEAVSDLVIVDVTVRDRDGKPIEGLKKEDFQLFEDGKPQTISVFESQRLTLEPLPPVKPALSTRTPAAAPVPAPKPATAPPAPAAAPAPADSSRYRDRRLIVLFFDLSAMAPPDQIRAQDAALQFLSQRMTAADLVAVMTFSTNLKTAQDFTDDRDQLTQVIRGLRTSSINELSTEADTGTDLGQDTGAAFVADETEFNIFNTDRKLSALESAVHMLATLPERKALVYFSSGVGKTGVENQSQLRATVNAAVRSNVAFYPVDARGLMALPPGGDASTAAPRGTGIFTGASQQNQRERFNDQQETLSTLAADTGGKAFFDSNELSLGIVQAQSDVRSYYILGYYSANSRRDGRYRRIKVSFTASGRGKAELGKLEAAKLDYRSGYFAAKDFGRFSTEDKERQLEEALLLGDPITDLPLALEVDYFWLSSDRYFIPVALKIPGSEISLAHKGANQETTFDFIGQVRDEKDKLVSSVRDGIRVRLDESSASRLARRNLEYDTGFTLPPGRYKIKLLARENQTGKMGTFETKFVVPDLAAQNNRLRLSSVVWSSQREPIDAAVGAAEKKNKLLANHPLVHDGQKLVPSITRVFRKDQNLYVYFEVYNPASDPEQKAPDVAATVSFYRGHVKAFESTPVRLNAVAPGRRLTVPFQFQLPLASLLPGRYICQVNVVDEVGRKFAFPRAPLVLLP